MKKKNKIKIKKKIIFFDFDSVFEAINNYLTHVQVDKNKHIWRG